MKKKLVKTMIIGCLSLLASCQEEQSSDLKAASPGDQLGATCYSYPYLSRPFPEAQYNLCFAPGQSFYPGLLAVVAKRTAIQACKNLNALDNGHKAGPGQSCYRACEIQTNCIPFTPR